MTVKGLEYKARMWPRRGLWHYNCVICGKQSGWDTSDFIIPSYTVHLLYGHVL